MGNEASRPMVESPTSPSPGAPPTPLGARRTQSFPTRSPSPLPVGSTPRAPTPPARVDRTIQRMDKTIRKRVRGGVTYNMKLLIRGDRGTGKTSLFHRLQGQPIPEAHAPTPQLQTATINWNLRLGTEESVKCEVWDVVDRGFVPSEDAEGQEAPDVVDGSDDAIATAAAAAAAAAMGGYTTPGSSGMHVVAAVDASTVDVYHEAHGVIFLLDVTKWETLEYVRQQLENVPPHIPTLVLGNFRDCAANQRKVFKEDIQDLLYGSSDRSHKQQALRRPLELLYFECSLLNCYGLKALHQYFGIPFLQLKLATIRQQLRIVEGEFSHLKNDLQATIREQRYVDYLDHIKATGSDIRTGRRASNASQRGSDVSSPNGTVSVEPEGLPPRPNPTERAKTPRRTSSIVSDTSDIVVGGQPNGNGADHRAKVAEVTSALNEVPVEEDLGDLPERDSTSVIQVMAPLKIEHVEAASVTPENPDSTSQDHQEDNMETADAPAHPKPVQSNGKSKRERSSKKSSSTSTNEEVPGTPPVRARQGSIDEPMGLEDFQVPGQRNSDLDHFYSESESDEEREDEDVVVSVADTGMKNLVSGRMHKQVFINSDSDESEEDERKTNTPSKTRRRKGGSPRHRTAPTINAGQNDSASSQQVTNDIEEASTAVSPPVSSPRPPSSSGGNSPSPRLRSRGNSPSRQPPSPVASSIEDAKLLADKEEAEATSEQILDDEKATTSVSQHVEQNNSDSHEVKSLAASANQVPSSPHSPAEPRRENRQTSPNSSRRNSAVSIASAGRTEEIEEEEHDEAAVAVVEEECGIDKTRDEADEVEAHIEPPSVESHEVEGHGQESHDIEALEVEVEAEQSPRSFASDRGVEQASDDGTRAEKGNKPLDESTSTLPNEVGMDAKPTAIATINVQKSDYNDTHDLDLVDRVLETASVDGDDNFDPGLEDSVADMNEFLMEDDDDEEEESDPRDEKKQSLDISRSGSAPSTDARVDSISTEAWKIEDSQPKTTPPPARPVIVRSDDDDDDSGEEVIKSPLHALGVVRTSSSKMTSATTLAPVADQLTRVKSSQNELEDFLNESDSESDGAGAPQRWSMIAKPQPDPRASSEDDEDDGAGDRLATYSVSRKSRAQRRQEQEELRQFSAALDASQRDVVSSGLPQTTVLTETTSTASTIENSDVLAAIRRAQEEALRMMSGVEEAPAPADGEKKRREKKKSKDSKPRRKSSRHVDGEEDSRSSRRSTKKSSSSSSRSRRSREQRVARSDSE